jgi:hypothetical protein
VQQVRVIVATGEEIEKVIAQELCHGWSIVGPVQWGGSRRESVASVGIGVPSIERVVNLYVATLVKEIS